MNYLALVNRLRQECGVSANDLTTTVGQSGEAKRCADWINEAWLDLQTMRQDWLWMRANVAFQTVYGQSTYTPAQCGLSDFGMWTHETWRNYANPQVALSIASPCVLTLTNNRLAAGDTVTLSTDGALPTGLTVGVPYFVVNPAADSVQLALTAGGAPINTTGTQSGTHTITSNNVDAFAGLLTEVFMSYLQYENWRNAYQYGALRGIHTRPMVLTVTPSKALGLGPTPAAGYTIIGEYYKVPAEMSADSDTPALPAKFHLAIVYRAMLSYGLYEAAPEVIQRAQVETDKWTRRIMVDQIGEIGWGGALA